MSSGHASQMTIIGWIAVIWLTCVAGWAEPAAADNDKASTQDASQSRAERITVWYATIRNRTMQQSTGEFYGGLRGEMRMGICALDFTPISSLEDIADSVPFYIPDERTELQYIHEWKQERFWDEVDTVMANPSGKIVFYVHGYSIGFEKSCRRAAMFQRSMHPHHRLLLFSWPADGNVIAYTRDEADLVWSVPRVESMLQELTLRAGPENLDVVAHSLGGRGVVMALARLACKLSNAPLINQLVLIAPDIDRGVFKDTWPDIQPLVRHTTLYVSENDKALRVSREAHGYPRLGEAGQYLTILPGIETIDVSSVGKRRFSGHIYHLYHPAVVADLRTLMATDRRAGQRTNLKKINHQGVFYWKLDPKVH